MHLCPHQPTTFSSFNTFQMTRSNANMKKCGATIYRTVARQNISGNIWDRIKSLSLSFLCVCHLSFSLCLSLSFSSCLLLSSLLLGLNISGNIWDRIKSERNRASSPGILYPQILVSNSAKYIECERKMILRLWKGRNIRTV